MKNVVSLIRSRFAVVALAVMAIMMGVSGPAWATDPVTLDTGAMFDGGKDAVFTTLGNIGPKAFIVLAALVGIGIAWKFFKKGAKSS